MAFKIVLVYNACVGQSDPSLPVDEQCHRHGREVVLLGKCVIADNDGVLHRCVSARFGIYFSGEKWPHHFPSLLIHRNSDDGQTLSSEFFIELHVPGDLKLAAATPGRPEIQQDNFTLEVG